MESSSAKVPEAVIKVEVDSESEEEPSSVVLFNGGIPSQTIPLSSSPASSQSSSEEGKAPLTEVQRLKEELASAKETIETKDAEIRYRCRQLGEAVELLMELQEEREQTVKLLTCFIEELKQLVVDERAKTVEALEDCEKMKNSMKVILGEHFIVIEKKKGGEAPGPSSSSLNQRVDEISGNEGIQNLREVVAAQNLEEDAAPPEAEETIVVPPPPPTNEEPSIPVGNENNGGNAVENGEIPETSADNVPVDGNGEGEGTAALLSPQHDPSLPLLMDIKYELPVVEEVEFESEEPEGEVNEGEDTEEQAPEEPEFNEDGDMEEQAPEEPPMPKLSRRNNVSHGYDVSNQQLGLNACICGKQFETKENLKAHLGYYRKDRTHLCPICNKRFPFMSYLNRHMERSHKIGVNNVAKAIRKTKRGRKVAAPKTQTREQGNALHEQASSILSDKYTYMCKCGNKYSRKAILIKHIFQNTK